MKCERCGGTEGRFTSLDGVPFCEWCYGDLLFDAKMEKCCEECEQGGDDECDGCMVEE